MSKPEPGFSAAEAAPVFAALGDATRLSLVARLMDGRPLSIIQLSDGTGLTRQGISKHLHVLQQAGLVSSERVGRENRFELRPEAIVGARNYLERASRQWDKALARLTAFLEADG